MFSKYRWTIWGQNKIASTNTYDAIQARWGLSIQPLTGREAELTLFWYKHLSFYYGNYALKKSWHKEKQRDLHNKADRAVSKRGQLQPRFPL